ncbi:MAG: sodium:alanine symporter family protein [Bacteriovoracaceae bacterium]|nr:sodium:alanine symporter family protein [Bacteriovoracaceae bacterium]
MLQTLEQLTGDFVGLVWGVPLVVLLVGSGILFTVYFGFPQIRFFKHAIDIIFGKFDKPEDKGEISHFQALCAALSATVGLGNIAGVAVAISLGGPGAVFWLWVAGFIGMCTKFTEVTLSMSYRDVGENGVVHGGPMFVIKNALSKNFYPIAWIYAFFVVLSSFGAGNMFQSNQMAAVIKTSAGIPEWVSGLIFCAGAFLILIGGIKRIGKVTEKMVPAMVGLYLVGAVFIIVQHFTRIPEMFSMIFSGAFAGTAAVGGFAGAAFKDVIVMGIRRATFSDEAGMGSAAMAHSAAKSTPIQEGIVALLEPFIDTIVVCTITAVALLLTGAWNAEGIAAGSEMTAYAFETVMGPTGRWIVTATVTLFAFSTLISWSYYGEQGITFIFGEKWIPAYRYVFIVFIFIGAIAQLNIVLNISDAVYGLLALPNMMACYILLPKVKALLVDYKKKLASGEIAPHK